MSRAGILRALLAALVSCNCAMVNERRLVEPEHVETLDGKSAYLKAHCRDGTLYVLQSWRFDEQQDAVLGVGQHLGPDRQTLRTGPLTVLRDSVALFETNTTQVAPQVIVMGLITGISVGLTAYCAANPKACFGSCPTFYIEENGRQQLRAEGFSSSVSPSLEATDIDALAGVEPDGDTFTVTMRNEALETHVVRHVDLLAVPHDEAQRVYATDSGTFWLTGPEIAPVSVHTPESPQGDDASALWKIDGRERFSAADSLDLAAREVIDFAFDVPDSGEYGLVLASRQTLMSTYLLYQALAWMGHSAGSYLARLERAEPWLRHRLQGLGVALGAIEVLVREKDASWKRVGTTEEAGPLAIDVRVVPIGSLEPGRRRVRLRLTRGYWRIDGAQLVQLRQRVEPVRLSPHRVVHEGTVDADARRALLDEDLQLVTLPGDDYTLTWKLPPLRNDRHSLFLESRGYYIEWMRQEWIEEENAAALAQLFFDPGQALRDLAPAFKKVEPLMEAHFWGSRYVR